MIESLTSKVVDDGRPDTALHIAGHGLRDFNLRTFQYMRPGKDGWRNVNDAGLALGELTDLAGGLPQALQQIMNAIRQELELELLRINKPSIYQDRPEAAVAEAVLELQRATQAAHQMYVAISGAQVALHAAEPATGRGSPPPVASPDLVKAAKSD